MRLLHVINSLDPATGGPAAAVKNFVAHPLMTEQSVLTSDSVDAPWLSGFSTPVHALGRGCGTYGF
ncbi:MAG TPA: transferase, partial [Verrucomicrobiae bacterium]|nr:transferase [Verrucomicrobiae bacterium]